MLASAACPSPSVSAIEFRSSSLRLFVQEVVQGIDPLIEVNPDCPRVLPARQFAASL
jgi:hypothetical protein